MNAIIELAMSLLLSVFILTLALGIIHRFLLFYGENIRAIKCFYPWTIAAIEHFNKEKKYRHWLTTFLCTIVGIIDTINLIPAFILILLIEVFRYIFKMIVKGIKYLIFADREEEEEEEEKEETNDPNLVFAYHTDSGKVINFSYNPKTNTTFVSKGL